MVITPNSFEYLILVVSDSKSFFLLALWVILEGWVSKNWRFWTVVLQKTCKSPLDSKEIKPVDLKRNQLWIFVERAVAEAPILWPSGAKSWLIDKEPDAGKDWGKGKEGVTEDEMVGWHHWLNGHEFKQILGDSEGEGSLACCSSWGHKELDNNTILFVSYLCQEILKFQLLFCPLPLDLVGWLVGLVTTSCPTLVTPWTLACQAPLPMGCSRQEYWSAISISRGSSWPRNQTWVSCIAGRFFTNWTIREAYIYIYICKGGLSWGV